MSKKDKETTNRIAQWVSDHGEKQYVIAKLCGVSPNTFSKACHGNLSVNTAKKISKALGISLDYIFENSECLNTQEENVSFLDRHIIPNFHDETLMGVLYSIPTVNFSSALIDYLKLLREAKLQNASTDFSKQALDGFIKSSQDSPLSFHEYILIPIEKCTDPNLLNDIGIYPKTDDTII